MPSVTREIHIDAPPHVVRRHVTDPDRRRGWLDEDADRPLRQAGRVLTFPTRHDGGGVSIELVPDGAGTRVRVTEQVELPGDDRVDTVPRPAEVDEVDTGDTPVLLAA